MVALLLALTLGSSVVEEDARRIQQHLLETEAALRANPPAGLTEAQRVARARAASRPPLSRRCERSADALTGPRASFLLMPKARSHFRQRTNASV